MVKKSRQLSKDLRHSSVTVCNLFCTGEEILYNTLVYTSIIHYFCKGDMFDGKKYESTESRIDRPLMLMNISSSCQGRVVWSLAVFPTPPSPQFLLAPCATSEEAWFAWRRGVAVAFKKIADRGGR